jgi:3-vinyl bacteriochlorophyllide hydratase
VLAPIQFLVFLVSTALVVRFLLTGVGEGIAIGSILLKTLLLYTIMITGSIWEKVVFGKWLFAEPFWWEDLVSFLVIGLHTLYLAALVQGWWTSEARMALALLAYAIYAVNATQFLLKLRAARLQGAQVSAQREAASGAASGAVA